MDVNIDGGLSILSQKFDMVKTSTAPLSNPGYSLRLTELRKKINEERDLFLSFKCGILGSMLVTDSQTLHVTFIKAMASCSSFW